MAYFGSADLIEWALAHPYANPLRGLARPLPDPSADPVREAAPWTARTRPQTGVPWVSLEASQQWRAFTRLIEHLQQRGGRPTVIVGPINEHMLQGDDVLSYRRLVEGAARWLRTRGVTVHAPAVLPSELYADLSHPLAAGYSLLAERVWQMGVR
jgi:hypothetical protein